MSTSSGRRGFCSRCGHANNEHAHQRDSKCKKCKKGFEICQAGVHMRSPGWKLCFIPCSCGKKYYPDKARSAVPLEPHEYVSSHPGYRPLDLDEDVDDDIIGDNLADADIAGAEETISTPPKGESWSVAQSGHTRTDSGESEDPLAWSPGTYQQRTRPMEELAEGMSNAHIEDSGSLLSTSETKGDYFVKIGSWCNWYWSTEYECEARYRQNAAITGGWEYEYRTTDTAKEKESQPLINAGDWSDWYWSSEYKCEARHRENAAVTDGWEYEYRFSPETTTKTSKRGSKSGKGKEKAKE